MLGQLFHAQSVEKLLFFPLYILFFKQYEKKGFHIVLEKNY